MAGPLIVLAELGSTDFAWLQELRRRHYPPDRNRVPAHLTVFRSLPPSAEAEVRRSLARAASNAAPRAAIGGIVSLDRGVALRVESPGLELVRGHLADEFRGLLSAQDRGPWTPHVTIQNKAEPKKAANLARRMREGFEARPLKIRGLGLVQYLEGSWRPLASWRFRGG